MDWHKSHKHYKKKSSQIVYSKFILQLEHVLHYHKIEIFSGKKLHLSEIKGCVSNHYQCAKPFHFSHSFDLLFIGMGFKGLLLCKSSMMVIWLSFLFKGFNFCILDSMVPF